MSELKFAGIPYLHLDVYQGHDHTFNIQVEDDSTKEVIRYIEGDLTCTVRRNNPQGNAIFIIKPTFNQSTNCIDLAINGEVTSQIVFSFDNIDQETFFYDIKLKHNDKDEIVCYGDIFLKVGVTR